MSQIKSRFKRWTGSAWVEYYFKTSADLIDETASYKVMTSAERDAIGTYLTNGFNTADKLVKINATNAEQDPSKIDRSLIGDLSGTYLTVSNPTFTGTLTGNTITSALGQNLSLQADITTEIGGGLDDTTGGSITLNSTGVIIENGAGASINFGYNDPAFGATSIPGVIGLTNTILTGLLAPVQDTDAVNKLYVDALVAEGVKPIAPVKAATTANVTLSGTQTIDGIALVVGDRVLVKNQTTASQNGIYIAGTQAWLKIDEESVKGSLVFVEGGDVNNDSKFYASTDTSWFLFSRTDTITATGALQKIGTEITVKDLGITNAMIAANTINLLNKTADFASQEKASYGLTQAATNTINITDKIDDIFSVITLLRGTTNYNTNNTETIAGAFDLAEVKNRTYTGATHASPTAEQLSTTLVTGDLYFFELAPEA